MLTINAAEERTLVMDMDSMMASMPPFVVTAATQIAPSFCLSASTTENFRFQSFFASFNTYRAHHSHHVVCTLLPVFPRRPPTRGPFLSAMRTAPAHLLESNSRDSK
jgi:hypothetical protein